MKREKGIYRPKLPSSPTTLPKGQRCKHKEHGTTDVCRGCRAIFGKVFWVRYSVNGRFIRESTECTTKKGAQEFLDKQRGKAANGEVILPKVSRIRYEDVAEDLRQHYKTTGERKLKEAESRLAHLDCFFQGRRVSGIGAADVTRFVSARQADGASNGTINRDLGVLGRMFRVAYKNNKLMRLPVITKLREADPRAGFFEAEQFKAVRRHLRSDLQVAVTIGYTFGWRMQSEILTLTLAQVDLNACTLRLDPGKSKNGRGRNVYLTPELLAMLREQVDRVEVLSLSLGRPIPYLFPILEKGPHQGNQLLDFRKAWHTACRAAMLEGLTGEALEQKKAEMKVNPKLGLLGALRHDLRRTAVRNLVRAGVSEKVSMTLTGHKTRSVFDRYDIVSEGDMKEAARKIAGQTSHSTLLANQAQKQEGVPLGTH
jgi:integrase